MNDMNTLFSLADEQEGRMERMNGHPEGCAAVRLADQVQHDQITEEAFASMLADGDRTACEAYRILGRRAHLSPHNIERDLQEWAEWRFHAARVEARLEAAAALR